MFQDLSFSSRWYEEFLHLQVLHISRGDWFLLSPHHFLGIAKTFGY